MKTVALIIFLVALFILLLGVFIGRMIDQGGRGPRP